MPYAETVCRCLYCNVVTGRYPSVKPEARATVCNKCQHKSFRDERKEVGAGMRPWMRPLSFWVYFFSMTPLPDDEAARYQYEWDEEQRRISELNRAHTGTTLEAK